jgi:hypothetical protein
MFHQSTDEARNLEEHIRELDDAEKLDPVDYVLKYAKERNIDLKEERGNLQGKMKFDGIIAGATGSISIYWGSLYLLNMLPQHAYSFPESLFMGSLIVTPLVGFLYSVIGYLKNRKLVKKLGEGANLLGLEI